MTDCFICRDGKDCEVNGPCPNCGRDFISHDEMRACRRGLINFYMHKAYHEGTLNSPTLLLDLKFKVRHSESRNFGTELQAYK